MTWNSRKVSFYSLDAHQLILLIKYREGANCFWNGFLSVNLLLRYSRAIKYNIEVIIESTNESEYRVIEIVLLQAQLQQRYSLHVMNLHPVEQNNLDHRVDSINDDSFLFGHSVHEMYFNAILQ